MCRFLSLRFLLATILVMQIWPAKGQTSDFLIPTQRDQGFVLAAMVEKDGLLYVSGYDVPMFGQDTTLYPHLWRYLVFDPGTNNVVLDSSLNIAQFDSIGYLITETDTSLLSMKLAEDSTLGTGVRFTMVELKVPSNRFKEVMSFEFEPDLSRGPRPFYWQQIDSLAYFHFNGDTNAYIIGPGFSILDTVHLSYPANTNLKNTPIFAESSGNMHLLFQGVSELRTSNCLVNPCNNLQIRRLNVGTGQLSAVNFPILPQFQPTGSTFLGPAFKNTDIKKYNTDTLIGIAQANSHNRPPYNSFSNYDISMSNQLVIFKFAKDLNANSFSLKFIPSVNFPIYTNDETTLDLVNEDYIYVAATQLDDYIYNRPTSALPYWNYFFSGTETRIKLFCLDKNLNVRWQTEIYDQGTEKHLVDIVALPDSGVAILMHESSRTSFTNPMNLRLLVYDKNGPGTTTHTPDIKADELKNLVVYPNPASEQVNIRSAAFKQGKLLNALGQTVMTFQSTDHGQTSLDIGHLTSGIYHIVVEGQNQTIETRKLVVQQQR